MPKSIKIALLMAASLFMEILDGTIVTTALPKIAQTFGETNATVALLVSVYLITVAVFIPLSGWLARRFGQRRIWLTAVLLFTASSLGSALAPNFVVLLGMRMLQGLAGSLMTPTARLIVLEKTAPKDLLKMMSYLIWPALIAPAIAPVVGGALATYASWHWIFLINVPIGLMSWIIGLRLLTPDQPAPRTSFDLLGFIEIAAASLLLLISADSASQAHPNWWLSLALFILGLATTALVAYHLTHARAPLFAVSALKIPSFRISQTGGSILWLSVGSLPYLLTVYLQTVLHWSALAAGSLVIFIFIGNIGIKPFTTALIERLGYRNAIILALALILASGLGLGLMQATMPAAWIAALATVSGVGRSLALTAYNGVSLTEVAFEERNSANTLSAVTQTLAQGIGVAVVTLVVSLAGIFMPVNAAYQVGFAFLAVLMLAPIIEVWALPKTLGEQGLHR
ncbi:MFS transporter [Lacticaseibacillus brantae]|uniref:Proton-dependent transporter n=1 Tax=Lacticaseibacillus brantae DSM 23927 TaxID=1423727 RepID=A0A0R2AVS0_9LACO|nr:MFS transporter [Lacticaseibacillus brantae]KRM71341.1 proton-dependent transporter [Lacticaseibacillus brantae DSM 23927]